MSPALWPIIIAIVLWLVVRLTGNETHGRDGLIFGGAVVLTIVVIVYNLLRESKSLNDKASGK